MRILNHRCAAHLLRTAPLLVMTATLGGAPAAAQGQRTVLEDPGRIIVVEGGSCARLHDSDDLNLRIVQSLALPSYADRATVLLNGWRLRYLDEDHHVRWIKAAIENVRIDRGALRWTATGDLDDKGSDDAFEFCDRYLALAWNDTWIDAVAHNEGQENGDSVHSTWMRVAGTIRDPAFAGKAGAAVLPRGFSFSFDNESNTFPEWPPCFACPADHHILQTAYVLDQSGGVSGDSVGWDSTGILKDNEASRGTGFRTSLAALAGDDLFLFRQSLRIEPRDDVGFGEGCIGESGGVRTKEFELDGIAWDYAVPVLTGWDLFYPCDDEHLTEIGAWIHDIEYDRPPGSTVGTLRYKLSGVLRDEDGEDGFGFRHKIHILGLNVGGPYAPPQGPAKPAISPGLAASVERTD